MGVCGACGQGEASGGEASGLEAGIEVAADASYIVSDVCGKRVLELRGAHCP